MTLHAQIAIFDGVDELDAIGPFRVLAGAGAAGADLSLALVTLDGARDVVTQQGLRLHADGPLGDRPDLLILPGGGWAARAQRGAWGEAQRGELPAATARTHAAGATLATVCTGAMIAATSGLLHGRHATTHHHALDALRDAGAVVVDARVVDDDDIISCGGVTSGLDLGLWLVERFFSPALANSVERHLEYERRGTVWRQARPSGNAGERACSLKP